MIEFNYNKIWGVMVNISFENSWNKFEDFIHEYMQGLQTQKSLLEKSIRSEKVISAASQDRTIASVLKAKEVLLSLDATLKVDIDMLEFFESNQASLLPQVQGILNKIFTSQVFQNSAKNSLENQKKLQVFEANILECQKILEGNEYSFPYLTSLLEVSSLTEKEKLQILSKVVYESSPKIEIEQSLPLKKTEVSKTFSVESMLPIYQELLNKSNLLSHKYYYLLEGKNSSQLEYLKAVVSIVQDHEVSPEDFQYIEEKMCVCLLEIFDTKKILEEFMKTIPDFKNVSEQTKDSLEYYLECLKDAISQIDALAPRLKTQDIASQPADNLIFLMNYHNLPMFHLEDFSAEEKNRIANLLRGLLQGKKDYERGVKHSKLLSEQKLDFDVFLNKNGDIAVSYVLLSNMNFLILTFDRKKDIYDASLYLLKKYQEKISSLQSENFFSLLGEQEPFKQELFSQLGIERGQVL